MASTEPLTSVTVQDQNDAATGGTQIGNLAKAIASFTIPRFATTTARDSAYTAKVAAGGFSLVAGLHCTVAGVLYKYTGSTYGWRPAGSRIITRNHTPVSTGVPSGTFRESGVNDAPAIAPFTLFEAATIKVDAQFRCGGLTGVALPSIKVNGATVSDGVKRVEDETVTLHAVVALNAGAHTVALRVDALGGDASWVSAKVTISTGQAE